VAPKLISPFVIIRKVHFFARGMYCRINPGNDVESMSRDTL